MSALVERTAHYVSIPSISGNEAAIAGEIEQTLRGVAALEVHRIGDNVIARTTGTSRQRVVVAGHLDTVPGEQGVEVRDDLVIGLGACDMKGSVAVMVELAIASLPLATEVTWIFYAREESGHAGNGLLEVQAAAPALLEGDVAILGEPTNAIVEAGCQGSVLVRLVLAGARAHTARPWRGRNAIQRLAGPIAAVAAYEPRPVELDGVTYTEQRQVVGVTGGIAGNVVPSEASILVNQRVAPDRTSDAAIGELRELFAPFMEAADTFELVDASNPAAPHLTHPVLAQLLALSGAPPKAKLGWTDVATFAEMGVPAVNFGAGDPELAHHAGEFVPAGDLERCYASLAAVLTTPPSGD